MINPHTKTADEALESLQTTKNGLSKEEFQKRFNQFGQNTLPQSKPSSLFTVLIRQFINPLIYILIIAAIFSMAVQEWSDAGFIIAVLLINAVIGTYQEYSAQEAALALKQLVSRKCRVMREGEIYEYDTSFLVPGDIVFLESGDGVPADLRLISTNNFEIDESLLTGESLPVYKEHKILLTEQALLAEKKNMAFTGTLVNHGRASGVVVATGLNTELGKIASEVLNKPKAKPPLLIRMSRFTHRIAIFVAVSAILLGIAAFIQDIPFNDVFMLAVALAISAIPEGLPIALTVALAVSMHKMAKKNVIIKELVAVEALGSCTYIATDKTGTLTVNQLTAKKIFLNDGGLCEVSDESLIPKGKITHSNNCQVTQEKLKEFCMTAVLANEAFLRHQNGSWVHRGDAVDVALLIMSQKFGMTRQEMLTKHPEIETIPFESSKSLCASFNKEGDTIAVHVKGAVERILPLCDLEQSAFGHILSQVESFAEEGYRVIALAAGKVNNSSKASLTEESLCHLKYLGLVAMLDPLRPGAKEAIKQCKKANIKVAMITGDHPITAFKISKELDLCQNQDEIITGHALKQAETKEQRHELINRARVFARIEPHQKLEIVQALQDNGHYVAVSGDGVNDAPALRKAHVGVAMGKSGTDVARESADIIITDDKFASIVSGIKEGRIAYANIRKVIFLLISTGAAELILFGLSLSFGLPLPLLPVQLLWLNLVTNGIQDVALALEPGEGHELSRPPRKPKEAIFNKIMIERVVVSAITMGLICFICFNWFLMQGMSIELARNSTLLLMVLFENIHVFNSRSETLSVFVHNPLLNPFLLIGTLAAQIIHIASMYTPWISNVLVVTPVSLAHWAELLMIAFSLLVIMESHKLFRHFFTYEKPKI